MSRPDYAGHATDLLKLSAENIRRKVVEEEWDHVTVITGLEGVGKSTLAAKYGKYYDPDFTPARNMVFTNDHFLELLDDSLPGDIVVADEAVNGFFGREAMSTENKATATVGMVARGLGVHWVLCIPSMHNLDPYWREHRVRTWIHVESRGVATYRVRKKNEYTGTIWWPYRFVHYFNKMKSEDWDDYRAAKRRYMKAKVREEIDRNKAKLEKKRAATNKAKA